MNVISLMSRLGALRVTGADANSFLQGQFSNDLGRTWPVARYGLWLDHKGKVQADSFALRQAENDFLLVSYFCPAEQIRRHLERSLVADEVTLDDETGRWICLSAGGEHAQAVAERAGMKLPAPGECSNGNNGWCFPGRRTAAANWEFLIPNSEDADWRQWLGQPGRQPIPPVGLERIRISEGIPSVPADIGPGDLPQEGGLDDAISYTKGCFLGQEVMARLKNLGQVRRRLHVVRGMGTPPPPQTAVTQGDKRIGETRSAAADGDGFVSMAMLSLVNFDPAAEIRLPDGRTLAVPSKQN